MQEGIRGIISIAAVRIELSFQAFNTFESIQETMQYGLHHGCPTFGRLRLTSSQADPDCQHIDGHMQ
jgi:hypothetical protein